MEKVRVYIIDNAHGGTTGEQLRDVSQFGGAQGPAGPEGPKGDAGAAGAPGTDGAAGLDGADGAQGLKGDKGDKGDPGDQGIQGEQGPQGEQGIQGPAGGAGVTARTSTMIVTTTTAALPLNGLSLPVSTGVAYRFDFGIAFATGVSTTGIKLGLTYPAASTFAAAVRIPIAAGGVGGEFQGWITSSGAFVTGTGVQTAQARYYAQINGMILPVSTGTVQVTYGTEVANSAVSTFAGCHGVLTTL
jgi:hypothetical protein